MYKPFAELFRPLDRYPDILYDLIRSQFAYEKLAIQQTHIRIHEIIEIFTIQENGIDIKIKYIVDPYGLIARQCILTYLKPMYIKFEKYLKELVDCDRYKEYTALHEYLRKNGYNIQSVENYIVKQYTREEPFVVDRPEQDQIHRLFAGLDPRLLLYTPRYS
jgi:hypothetical protein